MIKTKKERLNNLIAVNPEIDGIDTKDYPDFVDAYLINAEHPNGDEFTDEELDYYNENYSSELYDLVIDKLF